LAANRWVRLAFLALSLGFMALVMRAYWREAIGFRPAFRPGWLALSLAGLLPALAFEAGLWRTLLASLGHRLPIRRSAGMWFVSGLARYIPGNVWQFLGMMELGATSGVPRGATLTSVALHQVFCNLAGLLVGAPLLADAFGLSPGGRVAVGAALVVGMAAVLSPPVLVRANALFTRVARPEGGSVELSAGRVCLILAGYCAYWLTVGLSFSALGRSLGIAAGEPLAWASAFCASYVAGYLSLLTPSGLGVREGVLALLLAGVAGPGPAAVVALVARLWLSVAEVVVAAVAVLVDRGLLLGHSPEPQS
jgi:hypothetical protein